MGIENDHKDYFTHSEADCMGCSACINACQANCIKMEPNRHGFLLPEVDRSQCINCGICRTVCPLVTSPESFMRGNVYPLAFAAQSRDETVRYQSTSGGVFSELAHYVIERGGCVAGAVYDENNAIKHTITDRKSGIASLRQSKYAQSDKGDVFKKIKVALESGRIVLFVGAPCEVAGLVSFLKKRYDRLLVVDFICLGANSPLVYQSYLKYLSSKYRSNVKRIWFKYKRFGWEQFATRVDFENGRVYVRDRCTDLYMRGYIQKSLYLRHCCTDCHFKGFHRVSDITLGDFWGVGRVFPDIDRSNGVSAVCVNTEHGMEALRAVEGRLILRACELSDIIAQNENLSSSAAPDAANDGFFDMMEQVGFERAVRFYTKEPPLVRLRRLLSLRIRMMRHLIVCKRRME